MRLFSSAAWDGGAQVSDLTHHFQNMVISGKARSAAHVPAHNVCFFKLMVSENLWQLKSRWRASFVYGLQQRRQEKASLLIFARSRHDWRDLTAGAWKRRCRKVVKPASSLFHTIFNLGSGSDDELEVPCSSLWEYEVILRNLWRHPILCNEMKGPCLYWPGQGLLSNHWRQCTGIASVLRTLLFQSQVLVLDGTGTLTCLYTSLSFRLCHGLYRWRGIRGPFHVIQ